MRDERVRKFLFPLTAVFLLAWFLFFIWRSLYIYFDQDDMMNLYLAWSKPLGQVVRANFFFWSDFYRPMGALFYRANYALWGFNPMPFRVVCLLLGALNIALCGWFVRLVSNSGRVTALASLLFAFHPRLIEVWYRTSVIYDLLCFTFLYAGLCLYIDARNRGGFPGRGRAALILICHVCALNTKEMGVVLPVFLLAWELLFQWPATGRQWRRLWLIAGLALLNLPYIYGKTHGASALVGNPYYAPSYTWSQYQGSWKVYLQYLFLRTEIEPQVALAILLSLLFLSLLARSRILIFAWVVIVVGMLPVSFIPYRGGYALYISWAGWVLYGATILVGLQDRLTRNQPRYRLRLACLVFILVGWRFGKISLHDQRTDPRRWLYDPADQVRAMTTQMRDLQPVLPKGARLLFLDDSYPAGEWTPWFLMKLAWHDDTLVIDRLKMMDQKPADWNAYLHVFTFEHGIYSRLK